MDRGRRERAEGVSGRGAAPAMRLAGPGAERAQQCALFSVAGGAPSPMGSAERPPMEPPPLPE